MSEASYGKLQDSCCPPPCWGARDRLREPCYTAWSKAIQVRHWARA